MVRTSTYFSAHLRLRIGASLQQPPLRVASQRADLTEHSIKRSTPSGDCPRREGSGPNVTCREPVLPSAQVHADPPPCSSGTRAQMETQLPLTGTSAVITGGGRGIGRLTATALARAGARVAVCARTQEELEATAQIIREQSAVEVLSQVVDVADVMAVARFAESLREQWGHVDTLVNNAARLGPVGTLTDTPIEDWLTTLAMNVGSVAIVSRAMIPLMPHGGCIINIAGGGIGGPDIQEHVSAYTTSKAAVVALTEVLAAENAANGVRVNAVSPGAVATRFTQPILDAGPDRAGEKTYQAALHQAERPDHLAGFVRLVVWLASEQSSWLSGRLLSARWDTIERLESLRADIAGSSLLTLRRIDGDLFAPSAGGHQSAHGG